MSIIDYLAEDYRIQWPKMEVFYTTRNKWILLTTLLFCYVCFIA